MSNSSSVTPSESMVELPSAWRNEHRQPKNAGGNDRADGAIWMSVGGAEVTRVVQTGAGWTGIGLLLFALGTALQWWARWWWAL